MIFELPPDAFKQEFTPGLPSFAPPAIAESSDLGSAGQARADHTHAGLAAIDIGDAFIQGRAEFVGGTDVDIGVDGREVTWSLPTTLTQDYTFTGTVDIEELLSLSGDLDVGGTLSVDRIESFSGSPDEVLAIGAVLWAEQDVYVAGTLMVDVIEAFSASPTGDILLNSPVTLGADLDADGNDILLGAGGIGNDNPILAFAAGATGAGTFAGNVYLGANGIGNDNPILTFAAGATGDASFTGDIIVPTDGWIGLGVSTDRLAFQAAGIVNFNSVDGLHSCTIYNESANAAAASRVYIRTQGAGDVYVVYGIPDNPWSAGADNSDSDKFKIHFAATLANVSLFELTTAGALTLAAGLTVGGAIDTAGNNILLGAGGIGNDNPILAFAAGVDGLASLAGSLTVTGGTINAGVAVTTPGLLNLYGDATLSNEGGRIDLFPALDFDGVEVDFFNIGVNVNDLEFGIDGAAKLTLEGTGDWLFGANVGMGGFSITGLSTTGSLGFDAGVHIAMLNDGHLDLTADTSIDVNGILELEATTSSTGHITQAGTPILHTYGTENTFLGLGAGNFTLIIGFYNVGAGTYALDALTTGEFNSGVGRHVLGNLTSGNRHTALGNGAGFGATTSDAGVFLGYAAGLDETGSDKLFIDNRDRGSEADGRVKALMYGVFDAATASQLVRVNGAVEIREDSLMIAAAKLTFRDAQIFTNSRADGFLTHTADEGIEFYIGNPASEVAVIDASGLIMASGKDIWTDALYVDTIESFSSSPEEPITFNSPIEFSSTATNWEDLRAPATAINPPGLASDPDWDNTNGGWLFAPGSTEVLWIIFQVEHAYMEGSTIYPHLHWQPTDAGGGNVLWRIEYKWTNIDATDAGAFTQVDLLDAADGTALKHQYGAFTAQSGAGKTISSIISVKLSRIGGDGTDTYGADALLKEIDIHIERDTVGSRDEITK